MKYSRKETPDYVKSNRRRRFVSFYAYKSGVFLAPNNKWIARVLKEGTLTTLSQHDTEEEAKNVYDIFYNNK